MHQQPPSKLRITDESRLELLPAVLAPAGLPQPSVLKFEQPCHIVWVNRALCDDVATKAIFGSGATRSAVPKAQHKHGDDR